jgi:hypothetical protein
MGVFPIQRLKQEVKLSAAGSVIIVATLVFAQGVFNLWMLLLGATVFQLELGIGILGLIGGPLLVLGSRVGYWITLIVMTANAIGGVAFLSWMMVLAWYKFMGLGAPWGPENAGLFALLFLALLVAFWAVRELRSTDVQPQLGS